jgi:hypothetical protein
MLFLMRSLALTAVLAAFVQARPETVLVLTADGRTVEGATSLAAITVNGRKLPLGQILSVHNGAAAGSSETERIQKGLAAIQAYKNEIIASPERRHRDAAVEDLTAIGLPVVTPLLRTLKDTDQHEPRPLYRLFERLIPSEADQLDRQASLIRLANGEFVRGKVDDFAIEVGGQKLAWPSIRRMAVRRKQVTRRVALHSIQHCTQIEYLDTGIVLTAESAVSSRALGFIRMSWDTDGWASDADGLKVPGPNYKTNLVDGHPFGAIVGKMTHGGSPFLVGANYRAKAPATGSLHLAVNDNRHWQNNVGTFRVTLSATDAYDVGAAQ